MNNFKKIISFLFVFHLFSYLGAGQIDEVETTGNWQRVYLATFPRSGNHWIRFLIEEATHVATGAVYCDLSPRHLKTPFPWGGYSAENGCQGNCRYPDPGEIVVIKTHYPAKPKTKYDLLPAHKIIRVVRFPLDAFYSHFVFARHKFSADGKVPSDFARNQALTWKKFEEFWNKEKDVFTVRYEDLFNKPQDTLREVLRAIGYDDVTEEDIARAVEMHLPRGGVYKHLGDFHPKDLDFMAIELGPLVKKYGYHFNDMENPDIR